MTQTTAGYTSASPSESPGPSRADEQTPPASPAAAFADAARRLNEARAFFSYYLTTQLDLAKLTLRRLLLFAALGALGGLAGGAIVVTAGVLVCLGIARLIGAVTGYLWIGDLVTGIAILLIMAAGAYVGLAQITKLSQQSTFAGYQRRKQQQRTAYGTDVHERAHSD